MWDPYANWWLVVPLGIVVVPMVVSMVTRAVREVRRLQVRAPALAAIASWVKGQAARDEVRMTVDGVPVVLELTPEWRYPLRTRGHVDLSTTEVALSLRPQRPEDDGLIEKGLAVDLQIGDATFDAAFLVEGAPADVVLRLLDDRVRTALLAARPDRVTVGPYGIAVERTGLVYDAPGAAALAGAAAALALRLPGALQEADDARAREGAAYRQEPTREAEQAQIAARMKEIAELGRTQDARTRHEERVGWVILALMALALATCVAGGLAH
jgi:hypothetical protein